jgi:signal peptide peptidase SppA
MKNLAELASEPWLMEEAALEALVARAQNAPEARGRDDAASSGPVVRFADGVATVEVRGALMARAPWGADGVVVTSAVAKTLRELAADPAVRSIALVVDSPGGQASGIHDLSETVREVAAVKPVHALVDGMAASAAYWMVSAASKITASPGSRVGSIGVYLVALDASRMAENAGVRVHVLRSGAEKGVGTFGAPLTAEQLGTLQAYVDELAADFVGAVATGRGMAPARAQELATGRTWRAAEAKTHGLIDGVEPVAAALHKISRTTKERVMADVKEIEQAKAEAKAAEQARRKAILAAFPKDREFALEQIEADASLEEAKVAYCDHLQAKAEEREKAHAAELEAARKGAPAPVATGRKPVPHGDAAGTEAADYMSVVHARAAQLRAQGVKKPMTEAQRQIAAEQPDLRRAYIDGLEPVKLSDALPEMQDQQQQQAQQIKRIKR